MEARPPERESAAQDGRFPLTLRGVSGDLCGSGRQFIIQLADGGGRLPQGSVLVVKGANCFFKICFVVSDVAGNLKELSRHFPTHGRRQSEAKSKYG